jgi:hypothetical protein
MTVRQPVQLLRIEMPTASPAILTATAILASILATAPNAPAFGACLTDITLTESARQEKYFGFLEKNKNAGEA